MAPTIQNETDAGRAIAAMTETTRPIRIASRQLSGLIASKAGFETSVLGADTASMSIRRHVVTVVTAKISRPREIRIDPNLPQPVGPASAALARDGGLGHVVIESGPPESAGPVGTSRCCRAWSSRPACR